MSLYSQTPITFTVNNAASGVTVGGLANHTVNITTLSTNPNNVLRTGTDGGLIIGLSTDSGNILDLGVDNNLYVSSTFICSALDNCQLSSLGDVSNIAASSGNLLFHNGANWLPKTLTTQDLSDVFNTGAADYQVLIWNNFFSQYIPANLTLSISGGGSTETATITGITTNNINFAASGDLSVAVSSGRLVTYGFNETLTSLTFNSGSNVLTYTDENGSPNLINLNLPSGGGSEFACSMLSSCSVNTLSDVNVGSAVNGVYLKYNGSQWIPGSGFQCSDLNSCSINNLGDVSITSPSTNQVIRWNGSAWVNSNENVAGSYSFSITDGTTTQGINNGNTITFADTNCIDATVSATDTVSFSPKLSPTRNIVGGDSSLEEPFPNLLICTSSGLYVPCTQMMIPTPTTDGRATLKIPCNGTWEEYDIPWWDEVTIDVVLQDDPSQVGARLNVNRLTGELFYNASSAVWKKVPGTYGYWNDAIFCNAGTPKRVDHELGNRNVIVQVYYNNILKYATTVELIDQDAIRITTADTGNHRVVIYPVENLL